MAVTYSTVILDCDCSPTCGCPDPANPDKDTDDCCYCKAETDGCSDPNAPHTLSSIYADLDDPYNKACGCGCDDSTTGKDGAWDYTTIDEPIYNANGIQVGSRTVKTGKTWDGDCPDDKPDLIECDCKCGYDWDPGLCVTDYGADYIPDPTPCGCICGLTDADCISRDPATPVADTGSCTCVCNKPPCPAAEPDFDSSDCSCYCSHVRNNDCPADKPEVDGQCECYCPVTSCPSGETLNTAICECEPCPNSCNGCEVQDADCNCTGCADCDETEFCFKADPSDTEDTCICCGPGLQECGGSCVDTSCPVGQTWNWADCACECDDPNQVICNGTCKDPCPAGETFDANCICVPGYTASFLNIKLLP